MKESNAKKSCDDACSLSLFIAVILVGISQLITEEGLNKCQRKCKDEDDNTFCNDMPGGAPPYAGGGRANCEWTGTSATGSCNCKKSALAAPLANYPLDNKDTCDNKYPCCTSECCHENYKYCQDTCILNFWNKAGCLGDCLTERGLCNDACLGVLGSNIGCTS